MYVFGFITLSFLSALISINAPEHIAKHPDVLL